MIKGKIINTKENKEVCMFVQADQRIIFTSEDEVFKKFLVEIARIQSIKINPEKVLKIEWIDNSLEFRPSKILLSVISQELLKVGYLVQDINYK